MALSRTRRWALTASLGATPALAGCLDWDELRLRARVVDASAADGTTDASPAGPRPIVAWTFPGSGPAPFVDDDAPRLPDIRLRADPAAAPQREGGWLRPGAAPLEAGETDATLLSNAWQDAGGNGSVLLWVDPAPFASRDPFLSLGAFTVAQGDGHLGAVVRTTATQSDLDAALPQPLRPVHVAMVYRADQSTFTLYLDGALANVEKIASAGQPRPTLAVPGGSGISLGGEDWMGRLGPITVHDLALDEATIAAEARRGPP